MTERVGVRVPATGDMTLLGIACNLDCPRIANLLLEEGAPPNEFQPSSKHTTLHIACMAFSSECVKVLLEHSVDPGIQGQGDEQLPGPRETPLQTAKRLGARSCVKELMGGGVSEARSVQQQ